LNAVEIMVVEQMEIYCNVAAVTVMVPIIICVLYRFWNWQQDVQRCCYM